MKIRKTRKFDTGKLFEKLCGGMVMLLALTVCTAMCNVFASYAEYQKTVEAFTYEGMSIPAYEGDTYEEVNNNDPTFTQQEKEEGLEEAFDTYSELDDLGRCGEAYGSLDYSLMPNYTRGSISSITPSGWIQVSYDTSLVSGGYLYNRCHLIGFQLTGVDNSSDHPKKAFCKKDLITGTKYLNVGVAGDNGMVGFENDVAAYIKNNPTNHVLYRVTPIFEDDNLVAYGVLMEAESLEDDTIEFCVFCYNVQPGISIDYETGASKITPVEEPDPGDQEDDPQDNPQDDPQDDPVEEPVKPAKPAKPTISSLSTTQYCYVSKSGKKYHTDSKCTGKVYKKYTIAKAKSKGYKPCSKCGLSRKITVKYKKVSGAAGYQIAYKLSSGTTWKTVSVTGVSKTISGLKPGTKYSIKVRAYKKLDDGSRLYGNYSTVKTITTKAK